MTDNQSPEQKQTNLEGYVLGPNREYPTRRIADRARSIDFDNYGGSFCTGYSPETLLGEIDPIIALLEGFKLHSARLRVVHGATISDVDYKTRSVAQVLDIDFDCNNSQIIRYLEAGAKIGPYLLLDDKPLFSHGIGLWLQPKKLKNLHR